ncbi:SGNH/GDSL hydrolase family protein [Brevundimonas naejangsanensis]|uniref:SGNH/GDSL hydrolase family protein n=1 Tax=Brevundimonas naejangsanensis TaxID=588932 RepID=UPI001968B1C6|nr:SGNH/GDSL hydrolase family protein [Brevundimonas naejangsanensis]
MAAALVAAAGATTASAQVWTPVWTASPAPDRKDGTPEAPVQFEGQTVRQDMRLGASVRGIRLRISNELGDAPLRVADMRVSGPDEAATTPVLFDGRSEVVIPVGSVLVSDPVALQAPAFSQVSVSLRFPEATRPAVRRTVVRIGQGEATPGDEVALDYRQNVISAVYGERETAPIVVVAFGDSITEGATATLGAERDWPSVLARRFEATCPGQVVVLNQGISGNKLLDHGRSHSGLARLDRDILALPQVNYVIVLEGINDIRHGGDPAKPGRNAADMIQGYRQLVARLHDHGVKAVAGTLTPFKGSERYDAPSSEARRTLNAFMRDGGAFDGVVDFDAAVRDPADPEAFRAGAARDDKLHPNDEGYRMMAEAVDLSLFGCDAR